MRSTNPHPLAGDRYMRWAGHLLFGVLMGVGVARVLTSEGAVLIPVLCAAALCAWYVAGAVLLRADHSRFAILWLIVLVGGWALLATFWPGFVWVAFVLAMLCWHFLPVVAAIPVEIAVAAVAATASQRLGPSGPGAVIGPLIGIASAIAVTETLHRVVASAQRREELNRRLLETQEQLSRQRRDADILAERERLGSEVHDGAGQALAGIVMLLQSATDETTPAAQRLTQTRTALDMASSALAQTRDFLRGIDSRPSADSLSAAVGDAVDQARSLGLPTRLQTHGDPITTTPEIRDALIRAANEALRNAARHSGADQAIVTLTSLGDEIHLDVVDNGRGMPARPTGTGTGFGLAALRSRIQRLGGAVTIDSEPGDGTTVHVCLPVGNQSEVRS
ncbi:sensor histidine kinase [Gordonia sp. X0973]|uniref:sensor histidine kinase n=1 Tax=Gordonia sp. X0973 TaxID=2742602 RepID=UPI000F535B7D|nr:sensor histidine kinase [Gordonia sp. X0973]QKT06644.1 sensor histidine kinase [Gordonia sp. X0973]